ncbi:kinase-like domain-containing protein, partial [Hyaloraphidium curvatum]
KRALALLTHCGHPHLPEIHEVFETESKFYVVGEYCAGGDLARYLASRGGMLPEPEAAGIVATLIRALSYLHAHGIVHRDLKPANVLLRREDDVASICVADFGEAFVGEALIGPGDPLAAGSSASLADSQMKTMAGTPFYLAPEIAHGNSYTSKVDLWSLGCIAYELLAGRSPFSDSRSMAELFSRIESARYSPPAGASPAALAFLARLLDPDPARRPDAGEALGDPWI